MLAASEVMKMVNRLPPWRAGSLGASVSMLFHLGIGQAGDPHSRVGVSADKGELGGTPMVASDHLGEDLAHLLEREGAQDLRS